MRAPRSQTLLALALLAPLAAGAEQLDDWELAEDQGGYLGLGYSLLEGGDSQWSAAASLPLFAYSQLHLYYARYQPQDGQYGDGLDSYSADWNSDPLASWGVGLGYDQQGQGSVLAERNARARLFYSPSDAWRLELRALQGELEIAPEGLSDATVALLRDFRQLDAERTGFGLGADYLAGDWQWSLAYNHYDYRDPPELNDSQRQALFSQLLQEDLRLAYWLEFLGLSREQARALIRLRLAEQLGIYRDARRSQNLLSNDDLSLSLWRGQGAWSYGAGVTVYESHLDRDQVTQVQGQLQYRFDGGYQLGSTLIYSDDGRGWLAEVALGYHW